MIATIKGERVYGLDFYFYKMDLKNTPFEIEVEDDVTTLRAPYFGMKDKYGNGAILLTNSMYNSEDIIPYDEMANDKKYAELFKTIFGEYPNGYEEKEECEFCINHSEDDSLCEFAGWNHGYRFDEVKIKYCPICGRRLSNDHHTEV